MGKKEPPFTDTKPDPDELLHANRRKGDDEHGRH